MIDKLAFAIFSLGLTLIVLPLLFGLGVFIAMLLIAAITTFDPVALIAASVTMGIVLLAVAFLLDTVFGETK